MHIIIHQHRLAAFQVITFRFNMKALEAAVFQHLLFRYMRHHAVRFIHPYYLSRRMAMVQQGIMRRKAFRGKKLLGIQFTIRFTELCMPLMRDLPKLVVLWHNGFN